MRTRMDAPHRYPLVCAGGIHSIVAVRKGMHGIRRVRNGEEKVFRYKQGRPRFKQRADSFELDL